MTMAAMPVLEATRLFTYDDYARLTPEGGRYQLLEGEIVADADAYARSPNCSR